MTGSTLTWLLWKPKALPDQSYFSTRGQAADPVLFERVLCLKQGSEHRSILEVDAQDGNATFLGGEVDRWNEFRPVLGTDKVHQSDVGRGFER